MTENIDINETEVLKLYPEILEMLLKDGGINYFLWDANHKGKCTINNIANGVVSSAQRVLNEFNVFVRYNKARDILYKVSQKKEDSFMDMVSSRNPFGLSTSFRGTGVSGKYKVVASVGDFYTDEVPEGKEYIGKYKVLLTRTGSEHALEADNNGQFRLLSRIDLLGPMDVCTDTYILVGPFETEAESKNAAMYMKTKFFRMLMLMLMSSISISKEKFQFVPLQDYSEPWTDEKLYTKYGITPDEQAYIESLIKPME